MRVGLPEKVHVLTQGLHVQLLRAVYIALMVVHGGQTVEDIWDIRGGICGGAPHAQQLNVSPACRG
jgi:hypothetical protein